MHWRILPLNEEMFYASFLWTWAPLHRRLHAIIISRPTSKWMRPTLTVHADMFRHYKLIICFTLLPVCIKIKLHGAREADHCRVGKHVLVKYPMQACTSGVCSPRASVIAVHELGLELYVLRQATPSSIFSSRAAAAAAAATPVQGPSKMTAKWRVY